MPVPGVNLRAGHIKINLQEGIDVGKFDMLIANAILK